MAKKVLRIPFNSDGDLAEDNRRVFCHGKLQLPILKDNFEFQDTLQFEKYTTSWRGVPLFVFLRQGTGTTVFFTQSNFVPLIPFMERGMIMGRFTFTFQGTRPSCKMICSLDNPRKHTLYGKEKSKDMGIHQGNITNKGFVFYS